MERTYRYVVQQIKCLGLLHDFHLNIKLFKFLVAQKYVCLVGAIAEHIVYFNKFYKLYNLRSNMSIGK